MQNQIVWGRRWTTAHLSEQTELYYMLGLGYCTLHAYEQQYSHPYLGKVNHSTPKSEQALPQVSSFVQSAYLIRVLSDLHLRLAQMADACRRTYISLDIENSKGNHPRDLGT